MKVVSIGEAMVEMAPVGDSQTYQKGFAGDTLNTAYYLKAALPDTAQVEYVSVLGQDALSDEMAGFIDQLGIGSSYIRRDAARGVGLYLISLNNGERSFTYFRAQSAARRLMDDPQLLNAAVQDADLVYFTGISLAILPPEAREAFLQLVSGRPVAFDPNYRPALWASAKEARDWITRASETAQILLPSFDDEAALFGDKAPKDTAARYEMVPECVVKNGDRAVLAVKNGEVQTIATAAIQPVDTTGAGDSFNGTYLAARQRGLSQADAVRAGQSVAAQVVSRFGALGNTDRADRP